jgi:MFS family permease
MNSSNPQRRVPATTAVLATLCAMSFIMYVDRTNIATAALAIRSDLGLNNSQLGFVFSAFAMTYSLAMIPGSWIGDKVGAHKMLAICGVLWAIGTLLTGFAGGLVSLIAARFLVGLGESPIVPTSARALAAWTRPERRGFAQGITHSFARLGNASTPIIVVSLIAATSWRVAFIVLGLASLVWVAWWIWYYRDDPTQHAGITAKELTLLPGRAITARPANALGAVAQDLMAGDHGQLLPRLGALVFPELDAVLFFPDVSPQSQEFGLFQFRRIPRRRDRHHARRLGQRFDIEKDRRRAPCPSHGDRVRLP